MTEMHFYVTITKDGLYHVQNAIQGMFGQHHVHTKAGYERWKKGTKDEFLHVEKGSCTCGLKAGEVRDHTGQVGFNKRFV